MLVLTRLRGESIIVGEDIIITLVEIRGNKARIGIVAPVELPVHRSEVADAIARETGRPAASLSRPDDEPGAGRLRKALQMIAQHTTRMPDGGLTIRLDASAAERFRAATAGKGGGPC